VHQALDRVGGVAGPLLVAAIIAAAGAIWPAMAVLIIPGAVALLVLGRIRRNMGNPVVSAEDMAPREMTAERKRPESLLASLHGRLPRAFWLFAAASAATTAGLVSFAVIGYHLTQDHVVPIAAVPLIYAAAMGAAALAALGSGWLFDRTRGRVLVGLPLLVAAVPVLAFAGSPLIAIAGALLWGAAGGCWTPASRRWWPPSSRLRDSPPRTACSPLFKAQLPSVVASWLVPCTSDHYRY
jgi:hypothetical protein